jgi:hypothetical protein
MGDERKFKEANKQRRETYPIVESSTHCKEKTALTWNGCARFPIARRAMSVETIRTQVQIKVETTELTCTARPSGTHQGRAAKQDEKKT